MTPQSHESYSAPTRVLLALDAVSDLEQPGRTSRQLADLLHVSVGHVRRCLLGLELRGWVRQTRRARGHDAWTVTTSGHALAQRRWNAWERTDA